MFVRLTTLRLHPESLQPQGLFGPAYALRDEGGCPEGFASLLAESLQFFQEELTVPSLDDPRAIFWLRANHQWMVEEMWALATVLREAGEHVQVVTTSHPGYVLYEDCCQVAAIPFRDTYRRSG